MTSEGGSSPGSASPTPERVAELLGLEPLGFEGGYYRETHRSELDLEGPSLPARYEGGRRQLASAIFYMLSPGTRSLMHRLKTDEVYHFYLGDPVDLLLVHPSGAHEVVRLGPDILRGQRVQHVVPAGTWQGSSLVDGGRFALMGTTMAPGFDLADFELGRRRALVEAYPRLEARLRALTPEVLETERLELAAATRDLVHAELRGVEALLAGLSARSAPDWPPEMIDERAARFTLERLESGPAHRGWWAWYVIRRSDRALVGLAGYKGPPDAAGAVEVGFSVSASQQGQGYATEAAAALVAQALADARVKRVRAEVLDPEGAPGRVLEKLGFVRLEGVSGSDGGVLYERRRPAGP